MTCARRGWKRWAGGALLGAALLLSVAAHAASAGDAASHSASIGDAVALPAVARFGGGSIGPQALRGKVVVLAYFASYCPFCAQEAPRLEKLYRENSDRLVVIGVDIEHRDPAQAAKVGQWIAKYGLTYPVTLDYPAFERTFGKLKGLPVVQVIDRQGVLRQVEVGEMLGEDFDDIAAFARKD